MSNDTNSDTTASNEAEQSQAHPNSSAQCVPKSVSDVSFTDGDVVVTVEISPWSDDETVPAQHRHEIRRFTDGYRALIDGVVQPTTYESAEDCFVGEAGLFVIPPSVDATISVTEGNLDVISAALRCSDSSNVEVNGNDGEMKGANDKGLGVWFPVDFDVDWDSTDHSQIDVGFKSPGSGGFTGSPAFAMWVERLGNAWRVINSEMEDSIDFRADDVTDALVKMVNYSYEATSPGTVMTDITSTDYSDDDLACVGAIWVNGTLRSGNPDCVPGCGGSEGVTLGVCRDLMRR